MQSCSNNLKPLLSNAYVFSHESSCPFSTSVKQMTVLDEFSEMGPSVTDTLATASATLSISQEAMDTSIERNV